MAAYCKDDTPTAGWDDITEEDKAEAKRYGDLMGERPLASCQRSEEVIGSYSSSFNNKAASLIAFGAELRPLPFCMFPEETFDIAALVASGNVPVD